MKTLDRNDERIVKAIVAKYEKLKARIDNNSERIAKIDEEYRLKAEAKKRELVLDNTALEDEQSKMELAVESMYGMKMDEAIAQIADDTTEVVDETSDVEPEDVIPDESEETVIDEDEKTIEEEAQELADLAMEHESRDFLKELNDAIDADENNDDLDDSETFEESVEQEEEPNDEFNDIDEFIGSNDGTFNFFKD